MTILNLSPGASAWLDGNPITIVGPAGLDTVMVKDRNGTVSTVPVAGLRGAADDSPAKTPAPDLAGISEADWNLAASREQVIRPLFEHPSRSAVVMEEAAERLGCTVSLVYRLLRRYTADPRATSLLPQKRGKRRGTVLVPAEIEKVMSATIQELYLTRQQVPGKDVVDEVRRRCANAGLTPPGAMTVYRRIKALPPKAVLKARRWNGSSRDPAQTAFPSGLIDADEPRCYEGDLEPSHSLT